MRAEPTAVPDIPTLGRGRHRRSAKGVGCFMEYASVLAGERWSDHPSCTHPLLAALARAVNDLTSDAGRGRLAVLIPAVILRVDDPRIHPILAARCAVTALAVARPAQQGELVVSLLVAERQLALIEGRPIDDVRPGSEEALSAVSPAIVRWAVHFIDQVGRVHVRGYAERTAASSVKHSVLVLAAAAPAPDEMLHDLLVAAIADCVDLSAAPASIPAPRRPLAPSLA